MPTTAAASLDQVLDYVHGHADERELDTLADALKSRHNALRQRRALAVHTGLGVRLNDLSPKYLNGLTGTVETESGNRVDVRLDKASTTTLRYAGRKFFIGPDEEEYLLRGVPKSSCIPS